PRQPPPPTPFPYTTLFRSFLNDPRTLTPGFAVPGYFSLSMRNRKLGPQRAFQERADLSHNRGRHSLKFGFELVRQPWTNTQVTENRKSTRLNSSHVSISYA